MSSHLTPPKLKPGNTIAIVAPARKISPEELQPAIDIFKGWGLKVKVDEKLFTTQHQFAGSDHHRAALLQEYINDPSVNAIISARGGYGTVRIIDQLNLSALQAHPKWMIGYSDITVLHSHLFNHTRLATLHATMPVNMQAHNLNTQSTDALKKVLMTDDGLSYTWNSNPLNRHGEVQAVVVGGNLSVLYSLLASDSDIDTSGKILFLEDLDEYLYHIDRMMMALKRAGKLDRLAGLIVGGMSDMKDNTVPFGKTAREIIADAVKEYQYPVTFDFPAGHQDLNLPIILGTSYILKTDIRVSQLQNI